MSRPIHSYLTPAQRLELLGRCADILKAKVRAGFKPRHVGRIRLSGNRPGGSLWLFKVLAASETEGERRVVVTCLDTGELLACSSRECLSQDDWGRLDPCMWGAP